MARLIITRGLPGAGKTTRARAWVEQDPAGRARINRDDLRTMLHGRRLGTDGQETQTSAVAHAAVEALLHRGVDVVCDDTNLVDEHVQVLRHIAQHAGAEVEIWDMTDVPVQVCIARDNQRAHAGGAHIGEKTIRAMHDEYRRGTATPDAQGQGATRAPDTTSCGRRGEGVRAGRRFVVVHTDGDARRTRILGSVIYTDQAEAEHRVAERNRTAAELGWNSRYEPAELVPATAAEGDTWLAGAENWDKRGGPGFTFPESGPSAVDGVA